MSDDAAHKFLFVTCQVGAEPAVKGEMTRLGPEFRFAYSRPGFLTFKLPTQQSENDNFVLPSVFARVHGFMLGKATGESDEALAAAVWQLVGTGSFSRLHVFERDARPAGDHGYEPGTSQRAVAAREALRRAAPASAAPLVAAATTATPGERVLDCVVVGPGEWWVGFHRARPGPSCYEGGFFPQKLPPHAVSRAYLKMQEALAWSDLPITAGHHAVELGCAPGGSCQALLERGVIVTGVDPAAMHADVLANPQFTHLRKRAADVRRREFRKTRWLFADMNVAPDYTLDAIEAIITHPEVHVEGMLVTLKLLEWELAAHVPEYLDRIRAWGFADVIARQLHHGRQEICVAARGEPRRHKRGGQRVARRRLHG